MVGLGLLFGRLVLAGILGVAGVAKLVDRRGARDSLLEFGIPAIIAPFLAVALPVVEVVAAIAVLLNLTAVWGGVAALLLFALFLGAVGVNLARGRRPQCRCFGQIHSARVGWPTLARNGALAALAGLVTWGSLVDPGATEAWTGLFSPLTWVGAAVTAVLLGLLGLEAWVILQLIAQQGRLLIRLEALEAGNVNARVQAGHPNGRPAQQPAGLPVGAKAPDFRLPGLEGRTHALADLLTPNRPLLLIFTDPGCGPCTALLPQLGRWQRDHAGRLSVAVISRGDRAENLAKAREHGVGGVLLQSQYEVAETYRCAATPGAVLIDPAGTIASPVAAGAEAIAALVASATSRRHAGGTRHAPGLPAPATLGQPAPEVALQNLEGRSVRLADFWGHPTLLLFWNPSCGFCHRMVGDLLAWADGREPGDLHLLIVAAGTAEANRAMGLPAQVLLDPAGAAMQAFGAGGTPMAVLVDAQGKVASRVVAGADAVLDLARGAGPSARTPLAVETGGHSNA
jgi:peroxiredoxin